MNASVFIPGCTRQPGLRHLHVDGIKNPDDLATIIDFASRLGFASEQLVVHACLENPRRTDVADEEGHHELNVRDDLISTTLVEPFSLYKVNELVRFILGFPGATIELEHVILKIDEAGSAWRDPREVELVQIDLQGLVYIIPHYDPIEYHLALDPSEQESAPDLKALMMETLRSDIMVGTWYNFGGRRLRSNRFAKIEGIRNLVESDYQKFRRLYEKQGYRGETRVVAELILGIWSSPVKVK